MNSNNVISLQADAAITGHTLVRLTTSGTVEPAGAASTAVIGTALQDTLDGSQCDIAVAGAFPVHYVVASGVIGVGAAVKSDAGGKIQDHAGTGTAIGNALEASTADGENIRVLLSNIVTEDAAAAS